MSIRITPLTDPHLAPSGRRLAWLAADADELPVGSAFLRLLSRPGQRHRAEVDIRVHRSERRGRVGSRLLDSATAAAREDGRRCLFAQAEADSPGDHFLAARGFRAVLTMLHTRLSLADTDTAALHEAAARPHPGYRLESWRGTVPAHLATTFADSRRAMDDMPMDDADYGTVAWDVESVVAAARAVADRGDVLHTVVAIDTADDSVAGFTELVVPGDGEGDAQHYGTGVLPEHRGHGLGRWMKAESIRQARQTYPDLKGLLTDTAAGNAPMRSINTDLGYTPTHTVLTYQLDL
ncbi:GNAT family N-acetyltransferase [Streptomyces sp. NPDC048111]|uniref:GNAT family N-acetyltransferase n=1 Tax=Streptomyces sp. NPDC048111 TaxID=3365500 RepID=UPI003719EF4B